MNVSSNTGLQSPHKPLGLFVSTMSQVMLADFVSPSAIFYGTIVPIAVYNIARVLVVNPYLKQRKDKELKRKQEGQSEQLVRVKKEAQMAVELMTESVAKVVREEEAKRGWLIGRREIAIPLWTAVKR